MIDEVQAKSASTAKHAVKVGDWVGGYFGGDGKFVAGHDVKVLGGLPYGLGQFIMIPICLVLLYLAIVKGFEPLLLLPIGFGGLLANCPLAGVTTPEMLHSGVIAFDAAGMTFHIGQDGRGAYGDSLNAQIDDFIVYDGAMTEEEIAALRNYYTASK